MVQILPPEQLTLSCGEKNPDNLRPVTAEGGGAPRVPAVRKD